MTNTTGRSVVARSPARSGWRTALGLGVLSAVPLTAGALRLVQLGGGPDLIPDDPRFDVVPVALIVHVVGSAVFALVGVGQFLARFRSRHRSWHRGAGRVLVVAGLLVVASALWMTVFYEPKAGTGQPLFGFRLIFATSMAGCLVYGFVAIRRRDFVAHRAWMIRGYAIGLGAGTQVFTEGFGDAIIGTSVLASDVEKGAAWLINLAFAEWTIRRPGPRS